MRTLVSKLSLSKILMVRYLNNSDKNAREYICLLSSKSLRSSTVARWTHIVLSAMKQRINIKFCYNLKKAAIETYTMLYRTGQWNLQYDNCHITVRLRNFLAKRRVKIHVLIHHILQIWRHQTSFCILVMSES